MKLSKAEQALINDTRLDCVFPDLFPPRGRIEKQKKQAKHARTRFVPYLREMAKRDNFLMADAAAELGVSRSYVVNICRENQIKFKTKSLGGRKKLCAE